MFGLDAASTTAVVLLAIGAVVTLVSQALVGIVKIGVGAFQQHRRDAAEQEEARYQSSRLSAERTLLFLTSAQQELEESWDGLPEQHVVRQGLAQVRSDALTITDPGVRLAMESVLSVMSTHIRDSMEMRDAQLAAIRRASSVVGAYLRRDDLPVVEIERLAHMSAELAKQAFREMRDATRRDLTGAD